MGEYAKIHGRSVKLGTCEDLYYTTYQQLKEKAPFMRKEEGNNHPMEYLEENKGYRYRFPFPEEDDIPIGQYKEHNKGLIFTADEEFSHDIDHREVCVSTSVDGAYNINHYIKCPNSKGWERTCSPHCGYVYKLMQQKQVDGQLWIVCRCGYCGQAFRLDKDGAWQVIRFLQKNLNFKKASPYYSESTNKYYLEVIRRIASGYIQ